MSKQKNSFCKWSLAIIGLVVVGFVFLKPTTKEVYKRIYPQGYNEYVEKYSKLYDVDSNLVYAVVKVESGFDPNAHSSADANGLMQLTKDAFDWVQYRMGGDDGVTYENIYEPEIAIRYGVYMLKLLKEHMGTEYLAICAYHAGMENVRSWLEQSEYSKDGQTIDKIPYSNTEWYVEKVFESKEIYNKLYS